MLRSNGVVVLLFLLNCSLLAQGPVIEYGKAEELKGVTKIFIYTGTDVEVRQNMIKEIAKKLPALQILDRPDDAEILILFAADSASFLSNLHTASTNIGGTVHSNSTPTYHSVIFGKGTVVKPAGPDRMRVLMQFNESRHSVFERRPSTNIARDFVEAYLKVNGKSK